MTIEEVKRILKNERECVARQEIKDLFAKECVLNCYFCKHYKYDKAYLKCTCNLLNMVASIQGGTDDALTTVLMNDENSEVFCSDDCSLCLKAYRCSIGKKGKKNE